MANGLSISGYAVKFDKPLLSKLQYHSYDRSISSSNSLHPVHYK